jgi:FxsC-like protein
MNGTVTARESRGLIRPYFFLSYAHSAPLPGSSGADPDELVGDFFGDLAVAVAQNASRRPGFVPGFFDQEIPLGSDWNESMRLVMGTSQVFVPLCSAAYIARARPGQEWACFRRRLELAGLDNPGLRIVPVMWTPLTQAERPRELRAAIELSANEPGYADYTDNGLRALLKIPPYRESYRAVVNVLAKRIVTLAEKSPITPSEVPDIEEMKSPFANEPHLSVFVIETAAPTANTVRREHGYHRYGETSSDWRPFPGQALSLAEYAGQVARRLDFKPEVSGIKTGGGKAVSEARNRRPGIILIDPWFIADDSGRAALESAVQKLPRWVLPVIILDEPADATTQKLAGQVRDILNAAGALPTDSARRAARGVSTLDDFVSIMRLLVTEAERQYLRYRSGRYRGRPVISSPSGNRPSLRRPVPADGTVTEPDGPASRPDPLGETPDA